MNDQDETNFGEGTFENNDRPSNDSSEPTQPAADDESPSDQTPLPEMRNDHNEPDSDLSDPAASARPVLARNRRDSDDMSDAAALTTEPEPKRAEKERSRVRGQWDRELSPQRIAVELKKIEDEVRRLLEDRDPKRKRRLAGTRRWLELEEDILSLRYQNRIDEATLDTLHRLVARRHHLFGRLRFLARTRPTWNS